jgi:hypothetical protein
VCCVCTGERFIVSFILAYYIICMECARISIVWFCEKILILSVLSVFPHSCIELARNRYLNAYTHRLNAAYRNLICTYELKISLATRSGLATRCSEIFPSLEFVQFLTIRY